MSNQDMDTQLASIQEEFKVKSSEVKSITDVDAINDYFFNRKKGKLTNVLRGLKSIKDPAEKKNLGKLANETKIEILAKLDKLALEYKSTTAKMSNFDVTLPGKTPSLGRIHPLRQVQEELVDIFYSMGFSVHEGNELENELYCFEYLNIPATHPARDLQDTFYVKKYQNSDIEEVLRTHTSNMQVRIMEQQKPPLRIVVPGRVFRNEAIDASHEHTFYQMEGFVVDEDVSISNLTYVLKEAMSKILQQSVQIRLRPGYFPYVEPGFEADCSCVNCDGKGCKTCKYTGWVEMLGCGMIHPKVFESAGYEAGKYTGFAFGIGINRLAMLKYGIPDIREFMKGDLRFLDQF
ncbi:MAG: phenylalanine--tRNA ligase subunit alpha [bacterium]|nr:phenylalanine--tRNA ligase subunit alpha [bacterium]